jgi:hypothetical protein
VLRRWSSFRPVFDLAAVRETVTVARRHNKPYAVVINAAPVKRDEREAPVVLHSRAELDKLTIPVWSGQISQRASYMVSLAAGASVGETQSDSAAATEIARLWSAIEAFRRRATSVRQKVHLSTPLQTSDRTGKYEIRAACRL